MTLVSIAFGAGILATVNPCGFAMLPAFLAFYMGGDQTFTTSGRLTRVGRGLAVGAAVSVGFAGVFVVAGLVVSAGLRSLVAFVPWVAVAIGAALVAVGVAVTAGRHVGISLGERFRPGNDRSWQRMVVFGAAYAIASLACTLAVLLAVIAQALATHSPLQLLGVFTGYTVGSATVLTALAVSAAWAKAGLARWLRPTLPIVNRVAGLVLVASGAYLVSYWLPAIESGSGRGRAAIGLPDRLSARLSTLLNSHLGLFAAFAVTLVFAGVAAALARHPSMNSGRARSLDSSTGRPETETPTPLVPTSTPTDDQGARTA